MRRPGPGGECGAAPGPSQLPGPGQLRRRGWCGNTETRDTLESDAWGHVSRDTGHVTAAGRCGDEHDDCDTGDAGAAGGCCG